MKKIILFSIFFIAVTAHAQLEKGTKLIGIQTNLANSDIYASYPSFAIGTTVNGYGFLLVPTYGVAVQHNWIIGAQVTIGMLRHKTEHFGYTIRNKYFDIGFGPFTRYYLDITRNGKFKMFGMASVELSNHSYDYSFADNSSTWTETHTNNTKFNGIIGIGAAYFGKRLAMDLNISRHGLRLGLYKTIQGKLKK